jgi:excinuclease ABC subunit A
MSHSHIVIRGARQHNLKNVDVSIPRDKLVVFTGVSGSGKSSLAFDTIFAEGQRRYVESLSAYARQFLGQLEKPDVDSLEGLSPSIAIDQHTSGHNPRSTVGTITEIYDFIRLAYARIGHPHCPICGRPLRKYTVQEIVDALGGFADGARLLILGPINAEGAKDGLAALETARKSGFVRARIDGVVHDLGDQLTFTRGKPHDIEIVVDRVVVRSGIEAAEQRSRLADSVEQALKIGSGTMRVAVIGGGELRFSEQYVCDMGHFTVPPLEPASFSFNSPRGACPACGGLGVRLEMDQLLVLPRTAQSINAGAVAPWHYLGFKESYYGAMLVAAAEHFGIDPNRPLDDATDEQLTWLLWGRGGERIQVRYRGRGGRTRQFTVAFDGVLPLLERHYRETTSDATRAGLEQYMASLPCLTCGGARLRPEALAVTVGELNIAQVSALPTDKAVRFFLGLLGDGDGTSPLSERDLYVGSRVLREIVDRLSFLEHVGLPYLSLDRSASTLSGGESQRIRLATHIGSSLVGVLYVLDEPSVGLHQRDNLRLIATFERLRDRGNTVLVVEHDDEAIRAADFIVDIGPGPGTEGGTVVVAGTLAEVMACPQSVTGQFLSGRRAIAVPSKRRTGRGEALTIVGAREHNLKNLQITLPLGCLVAVTGVSGSGKSTLIDDILTRALAQHLHHARVRPGTHDRIEGVDYLDKLIAIDQSPIGRTPRSNPATYTGAFGPLRELFSKAPEARLRGYGPGRFSFNVKGGRCEACHGEGVIQVEMQFLPDIYVPCEVCKGKRFNREALEITVKGLSIADVLDLTVGQALEIFANVPALKSRLGSLASVGLGYVRLGQSATTLSGGEAQRVKLSAELARKATGRTLYVLDEPTSGLHPSDVDLLLHVLQRLVDAGNTVIVVEHNLDVIKVADWVIDLGPSGGEAGGYVVAQGTPEQVSAVESSFTGCYLRKVLSP